MVPGTLPVLYFVFLLVCLHICRSSEKATLRKTCQRYRQMSLLRGRIKNQRPVVEFQMFEMEQHEGVNKKRSRRIFIDFWIMGKRPFLCSAVVAYHKYSSSNYIAAYISINSANRNYKLVNLLAFCNYQPYTDMCNTKITKLWGSITV
jgi:hypothetical protein